MCTKSKFAIDELLAYRKVQVAPQKL